MKNSLHITKTLIAKKIATLGSLGYSTYMPGTLASFITLLCLYILQPSIHFFAITIMILCWLGTWASHITAATDGIKDPSYVVIDEVVGMMIALMAVQYTWFSYVIAFVLFRFFDIAKPFPIQNLEQRFSGGVGIMIDDIVAGLFTRCCLWGIMLFFSV